MEKLSFITQEGITAHTSEWDTEGAEWDADGWLQAYGCRVGSGTAPLPDGGWIDLGQIAVITKIN